MGFRYFPLVHALYYPQKGVLYINASVTAPKEKIPKGEEYLHRISFDVPLERISDTNEVRLGPDEVDIETHKNISDKLVEEYTYEVISASLKFDSSPDDWPRDSSGNHFYVSGTFTIDYLDTKGQPGRIDEGLFKIWASISDI